ncbi:MAG: fatty acid desaturase [Cypionkella sp.]
MRQDQAFVATLPTEVRAALQQRSDRAGLHHLLAHGGLIALSGAWIGFGVPLWWALLLVHGVLLVFLFTLEHEATHKTPFANANLNEWVGRICGVILLLPFDWFRYFHLAHHRWTNIEGRDPELAGQSPKTVSGWLWHVSGLPYWMSQAALMLRLIAGNAGEDYIPPQARPKIVAQARWMGLVYAIAAATLFVSDLLFWIWVLPVVLGQPALRLYLLAEHGDCPRVADMFANTRTTYTSAIVRFLAWNMPYHVEHHVFPTVPFHLLPALHTEMQDRLIVTAEGYRAFTYTYLQRRR